MLVVTVPIRPVPVANVFSKTPVPLAGVLPRSVTPVPLTGVLSLMLFWLVGASLLAVVSWEDVQ